MACTVGLVCVESTGKIESVTSTLVLQDRVVIQLVLWQQG